MKPITTPTCDRCGYGTDEIGCNVCFARDHIEIVVEKSVRRARHIGERNRLISLIPVELWHDAKLGEYAVVRALGERIECFQSLDERMALGVMP